jgi:Holliday junction resolvasome RuvABC endonuclease subunit
MMRRKVAGVDYSLSCPAIFLETGIGFFRTNIKKYFSDWSLGSPLQFHIRGSLHSEYTCEEERYNQIAQWVLQILKEHDITEVYLEDYSYGSSGKVFHIAENTGTLKHILWKENIKINLVAPTAVKKFATGKGNADKWTMHEQFKKDTGINLSNKITPDRVVASNPVNDIVDSYYILKYGEDQISARAKEFIYRVVYDKNGCCDIEDKIYATSLDDAKNKAMFLWGVTSTDGIVAHLIT